MSDPPTAPLRCAIVRTGAIAHKHAAAVLDNPRGEIQVGDRTVSMRARPVRSDRIKTAVSEAYFAKYDTPSSLRYCRGFARGKRRETTTELVPR